MFDCFDQEKVPSTFYKCYEIYNNYYDIFLNVLTARKQMCQSHVENKHSYLISTTFIEFIP